MSTAFLFLAAALSVAFPPERGKLPPIGQTYVIGAVADPALPLACNGTNVVPSRTGAFLVMMPVTPGTNRLFLSSGTNTLLRTFSVARPVPSGTNRVAAAGKPHDPWKDLNLASNVTYAARPPRGTAPSNVLVMVDAGHGARDTGALSPHGYFEKTFNLLQAQAVADSLRGAGFRVKMTRTGDTFPALYERPKRAIREKADAFISIHHNATAPQTDPRAKRHTVAYAWNEAGRALATALQAQIAREMAPVTNLGAQVKSLAVCRNPAIPSCLLEIDFINLPEGEEDSASPERRQRIANAITRGLLDWLANIQ